MIKTNFLQSETNKVGCFESSEENEMFAKGLVSAISKGNDRISFTLTEKGAIAFARELSEYILAENAGQASGKGGDDGTLLPKQEVMETLGVSSTTLWQWDKSRYLVPVKIGRKVFYRKGDIDKLYDYKH